MTDPIRRSPDGQGMFVALLGPDGVGKSSVIAVLATRLGSQRRPLHVGHWAPRLLRHSRHEHRVSRPHAVPPRNAFMSVIQLAYLWLDFTVGYFVRIRKPVRQAALVVFDRYFPDLIVDPRRYRYGGPIWLARLAWRFMPKPNVVILLDAPEDVVHKRTQEVTLDETRRQRHAYRTLVESLPNGRVVDAAQPLDKVVDLVTRLICEAAEID